MISVPCPAVDVLKLLKATLPEPMLVLETPFVTPSSRNMLPAGFPTELAQLVVAVPVDSLVDQPGAPESKFWL